MTAAIIIPAAVYARVSTVDQTTANQLTDLRRLAEARGWSPVLYEEQESAAKVRPVLERLMLDARAGKVRGVVVWALDRLDRNMVACILRVVELDRLGVPVVSAREPWLDTAGPTRPLLVAIFGWVAEQERSRLIERTRAGLDRARREDPGERAQRGKKAIGRPRTSPVLLSAAADLIRPGTSIREAAQAKGVPESTLRRFLAARRAASRAAAT